MSNKIYKLHSCNIYEYNSLCIFVVFIYELLSFAYI